MRLDIYLADTGMLPSRSKAAEAIRSGVVTVNGAVAKKASAEVLLGDDVRLTEPPCPYVSRGGVKLKAAIDAFAIDVFGKRALDIGASTGGFTDCLLKEGALCVTAVDSGMAQLHRSLINDSRVRSVENFNARYLSPENAGSDYDIVVADVSFISQTYILRPAASVMCDGAFYIGLIKPQFEAGRENVGKRGVVKDRAAHIYSIRRVLAEASEAGLEPLGLIPSPVKGGDGNTEFLFFAEKRAGNSTDSASVSIDTSASIDALIAELPR